MNHDSKHREIDTVVKAKGPRRAMEHVLELDEANGTVRWSSRPCEGRSEGSGRTQKQPALLVTIPNRRRVQDRRRTKSVRRRLRRVKEQQARSEVLISRSSCSIHSRRSVVTASTMSHRWCEIPEDGQGHSRNHVEEGCERDSKKRKDETIHPTTWTTHHQTPQRSTTQHSTSWRSATDATLPGHREHTGGSRQDTHGTPVLTTVRRPWVAQPHEHAHATQVTDTSCEYGWVATKQLGSGVKVRGTT